MTKEIERVDLGIHYPRLLCIQGQTKMVEHLLTADIEGALKRPTEDA